MRFFQRSAVVIVDDGPTTPGPVGPDGDRLADLVGVVAVLVQHVQPHLGDVVEVDRQPQPDRLALLDLVTTAAPHDVVVDLEPRLVIPDQVRFLLQRYEVRLSVGTVPPSTRSVLQTSALRARSG
jgi:hypothetical protein